VVVCKKDALNASYVLQVARKLVVLVVFAFAT
jgi:hypothetical protein